MNKILVKDGLPAVDIYVQSCRNVVEFYKKLLFIEIENSTINLHVEWDGCVLLKTSFTELYLKLFNHFFSGQEDADIVFVHQTHTVPVALEPYVVVKEENSSSFFSSLLADSDTTEEEEGVSFAGSSSQVSDEKSVLIKKRKLLEIEVSKIDKNLAEIEYQEKAERERKKEELVHYIRELEDKLEIANEELRSLLPNCK
jgi:hypothetical protein